MRGMQEYYKNIEDKLKELPASYIIHYACTEPLIVTKLSCCLVYFLSCFVAIARAQNACFCAEIYCLMCVLSVVIILSMRDVFCFENALTSVVLTMAGKNADWSTALPHAEEGYAAQCTSGSAGEQVTLPQWQRQEFFPDSSDLIFGLQ